MSKEKAVDELRNMKIQESNLDINEPTLRNFDISDVLEAPEKQAEKKVFGKRSKRKATEVKIKEINELESPKDEQEDKFAEELSITIDDVAPAVLEVQPEIVDSIQNGTLDTEQVPGKEIEEESDSVEDEDPISYDLEEEEDFDQEDEDVFYQKKRFLASQYAKLEEYLEKQSQEGYHFIRRRGKKFYFKQGEPKHYYYSCCYFQLDPLKEDWQKWEKDGWKLVGRGTGKNNAEAGWYIFRNYLPVGEYKKEIDNESEKYRLFRKLSSSYRSTVFLFFVVMAVCGVTGYLQYQYHGFLATLIACGAIAVISLFFFILYARYYFLARSAFRKLKTTLRLKEKDAFIRTQNVPDYSESQEELDKDWDELEKQEEAE